MHLKVEIEKRVWKSDRTTFTETFGTFKWKDRKGRVFEVSQSIFTFKFAAVLKFFGKWVLSPDHLHTGSFEVKDEDEVEFLGYVALIPARYWQVWQRVCEMVTLGWSRRRILHFLATKAIALQLRR